MSLPKRNFLYFIQFDKTENKNKNKETTFISQTERNGSVGSFRQMFGCLSNAYVTF